MSFTSRTTSLIIGDGEFIAGNLVFLDEETSPQSEGWDMKTERWAIRRAVVTAEDAVEFFPTGSRRGETPWWVQSARPQRVAPGVWEIQVSLKGWAGTKPKHFRGAVNLSDSYAVEYGELGQATKVIYGTRIYAQYVAASHTELDAMRAAMLLDLDSDDMAAAFPVAGDALAKYQADLAKWQVDYDAWYATPARLNHMLWEAAAAAWDAGKEEYAKLILLYQNELADWREDWTAWDAGRPAEIRAQEAWDAADAAFDARHAAWAASASWNVLTAQVVRSGFIVFPWRTNTVMHPTAQEACSAKVRVPYTSLGSLTEVVVWAAITVGMTPEDAATAIAAAINANGTLAALITAAAVSVYDPGTVTRWCVQLTRNTTAANDPNLGIDAYGESSLNIGGDYAAILETRGNSQTVVYGIGTVLAEPVWTGGSRPLVTTAETAAPTPPTYPDIPGRPLEPELEAPPVQPAFPVAKFAVVDSQTERLTGAEAVLVTDTINQIFV